MSVCSAVRVTKKAGLSVTHIKDEDKSQVGLTTRPQISVMFLESTAAQQEFKIDNYGRDHHIDGFVIPRHTRWAAVSCSCLINAVVLIMVLVMTTAVIVQHIDTPGGLRQVVPMSRYRRSCKHLMQKMIPQCNCREATRFGL